MGKFPILFHTQYVCTVELTGSQLSFTLIFVSPQVPHFLLITLLKLSDMIGRVFLLLGFQGQEITRCIIFIVVTHGNLNRSMFN